MGLNYNQVNDMDKSDLFNDGLESMYEKMELDILEALSRSIHRASKEERLIKGLSQSVELLDDNPDEVMYCILPSEFINDITLQLHIKLLEAYCCENDIPLVKIDLEEKCPSLLPTQEANETNSCFLVKYPEETDADDEDVITYFQNDSPYSYLFG